MNNSPSNCLPPTAHNPVQLRNPPGRRICLPATAGWLGLWLLALLALPVQASCARNAHHCVDEELLSELTGWAQRLTRLPQSLKQPVLSALPPSELRQRVCGGDGSSCLGLAAVYDTDRQSILYMDTLDMRDPTDQSFIVHELVHFLQHQVQGDRLHASCGAVLASERQAYAAQNRYLDHFKQWRRVGEVMRYTTCPSTNAGAEPLVVRQGVGLQLPPEPDRPRREGAGPFCDSKVTPACTPQVAQIDQALPNW